MAGHTADSSRAVVEDRVLDRALGTALGTGELSTAAEAVRCLVDTVQIQFHRFLVEERSGYMAEGRLDDSLYHFMYTLNVSLWSPWVFISPPARSSSLQVCIQIIYTSTREANVLNLIFSAFADFETALRKVSPKTR